MHSAPWQGCWGAAVWVEFSPVSSKVASVLAGVGDDRVGVLDPLAASVRRVVSNQGKAAVFSYPVS